MKISKLIPGKPNFSKEDGFDLIFFAVALLLSYYFMQLRFSLNMEYLPGSLAALTNYSAFKPFQYRILMPGVANLLRELSFYPFNSFSNIFQILETTSIFLIIVSFRYYVSLFIKKRVISSLLAFSILCILPFNFLFPRLLPVYYPSDMPSIFLFTLGLTFMYQRKWAMYYLLFVIATLNRETSCFLVFIYLVTSIKREKLSVVMYHCLAQCIIWAAIKMVLFKLFFHNPGPNGFEWYYHDDIPHIVANASFLGDFRNYPFLVSSLGAVWVVVLCYYRLIKIDFVKRSVLVVFPFYIGMMFMGNIWEIRIFGELIPVFLMAFLVILKELVKPHELSL